MSLHPDFPSVDGTVNLTSSWSIKLSQAHSRRVEDGSLVLWRPNFTIWINIWKNTHNQSIESRLKRIVADASPNRFNETSEFKDRFHLFTYRLGEESDEEPAPSYYGHAIGPNDSVQLAIYFDDLNDANTASEILESIRFETAVHGN